MCVCGGGGGGGGGNIFCFEDFFHSCDINTVQNEHCFGQTGFSLGTYLKFQISQTSPHRYISKPKSNELLSYK